MQQIYYINGDGEYPRHDVRMQTGKLRIRDLNAILAESEDARVVSVHPGVSGHGAYVVVEGKALPAPPKKETRKLFG